MKGEPLLLCLDAGSSACKGALIDAHGRLLRLYRQEGAPLKRLAGARVEQVPDQVWNSARDCISGLLAAGPEDAGRVAAISLSAQMSTHLLVARDGRPLTSFLSWADARADLESRELAADFSRSALQDELGATLPTAPSWAGPKIKWLRRHEPALLDQAAYLVQPKDWILWNLCGAWASDLSSLRGWVNQKTGRLSPRLAKWAGIDSSIVPPILAPDSVAGSLRPGLAEAWRLRRELPVYVGWNDLAAAVLGSVGMPDQAMGFDITGTSEHLGLCRPATEAATPDFALAETPLLGSHQIRYGVTSSSGRTLRWYWQDFRRGKMDDEGFAKLEAEAADENADGLLFLPCLDGERAPWFNPRTHGTFSGITSNHRLEHFSRAVLEGIAFTLRSIEQRLAGADSIREYRVVAGGSAMALWNQMKADIFQKPFVTLQCAEAGCLGAAMLAARGLGWHDSWPSVAQAFLRPARTFEPRPELAAMYAEQHARFEKLYRAMEPLFEAREAAGTS